MIVKSRKVENLSIKATNIRADWDRPYRTLNDLRMDFETFEEEGWYSTSRGDTVLILKSLRDGYRVYCWNDRDPRLDILRIIGLPTFKG